MDDRNFFLPVGYLDSNFDIHIKFNERYFFVFFKLLGSKSCFESTSPLAGFSIASLAFALFIYTKKTCTKGAQTLCGKQPVNLSLKPCQNEERIH